MKMYVISDNVDTQIGMRLVGVDGVVAHTNDELKTALYTALSNKEIGILLISEKLSKEFPELIDDVRQERKMPLMVLIPDRHGSTRGKDFISAYVRDAIGVKLS